MPKQRGRQVRVLTFATFAGLALGLLDSSPGFDATGITAVALIAAGVASTLIDGSGALGWATLYALLLVAPIIALESAATPAAVVAIAFPLIGSIAAAVLLRLRGPRLHGT